MQYVGLLPGFGPAFESRGTVAEVAGAGGRSIHPDPARLMTYVRWDDGHGEGVFTRDLQRIKES